MSSPLKNVALCTASDTSHFYSQMQLLDNLKTLHPEVLILVVDLGWLPEERKQLKSEFPGVLTVKFPYAWFPEWMAIRKKNGLYGWKAQIVRYAANFMKPGVLVWSDAENLFTDLRLGVAIARKFGVSVSSGAGSIRMWTDKRTMDIIGVPEHKRDRPNKAGAMVAFDLTNPVGAKLLNDWADLSLRKEVIAPEGTEQTHRPGGKGLPGGHRQDLSVLSCLVAKLPFEEDIPEGRPGWTAHQAVDKKVRKGVIPWPTPPCIN